MTNDAARLELPKIKDTVSALISLDPPHPHFAALNAVFSINGESAKSINAIKPVACTAAPTDA